MTRFFIDPISYSNQAWKDELPLLLILEIPFLSGAIQESFVVAKEGFHSSGLGWLLILIAIPLIVYGFMFYWRKKSRSHTWLRVDEQGILWHHWKKEVLVRWDQVHEVRFSKGYSYLLNPNTLILKTDIGSIRLSLYWVDRDKPLPEIRFRSKGRLALLKREDGSIQEVQPETSEILTSLKKYLHEDRFKQGWFFI